MGIIILVVARARRILRAHIIILRAPKREEGKNTSAVFGQVFVRSRNVFSYEILLFSRDCHNYDRHNTVSRIK